MNLFRSLSETKWVAILLVAGFLISLAVIKIGRAGGRQPRFYQENFGPAVMMACGYGFTAPPFAASPPSLFAFLRLQRNDFSCEDLPKSMPTEAVTWNGTWYYLYGTVSLVWRVAGITWTSLDALAAFMAAIAFVTLYGLFRLVTNRLVATAATLFVTSSPAHVDQIPMLRDFSKGPFVLAAVLVLAWLVVWPLSRRSMAGLAALFGAIVGVGFGFRSDVGVMLPFGLIAILLLLPGGWRAQWLRNLGLAAIAVVTFLVAGYPPLMGQTQGGCQFHYALLGLTAPPVRSMNIDTPIYAFGDHFLDTFVDLKVGDYANRVLGQPVPNLCAPEYDRASADMYFGLVRVFPADVIAHAYGSALAVLRSGFTLPRVTSLVRDVPIVSSVTARFDSATFQLGGLGPLITAAAAGLAWSIAPRLGIAFAVFVLFLTGYPAIEYESRHMFHLRFIPVWSLVAIVSAWFAAPSQFTWPRIRGAGLAVACGLVAMALALGVTRLLQRASAGRLIESYTASATEPLPFSAEGPSRRRVDWHATDFAPLPAHRSSDMIVVNIAPAGCGASGPIDLRIAYDADNEAHDMSSVMRVIRVADRPTSVFFPVFSQAHLDHSYLRFAGLETPGRPADCITAVSRFADRDAVPLWIQAQAPPDWRSRPLYQRLSFLLYLGRP